MPQLNYETGLVIIPSTKNLAFIWKKMENSKFKQTEIRLNLLLDKATPWKFIETIFSYLKKKSITSRLSYCSLNALCIRHQQIIPYYLQNHSNYINRSSNQYPITNFSNAQPTVMCHHAIATLITCLLLVFIKISHNLQNGNAYYRIKSINLWMPSQQIIAA